MFIKKTKFVDHEAEKPVFKKPSEIKTPKIHTIDIHDEKFSIVQMVKGNDLLIMPKDTYDKQQKTVLDMKYAWKKEDLNEYLRNVWKPIPDKYYKIYMLTSGGWKSGKTYEGKNLTEFCNYSNVIDSDRNYNADDDDELIYAINIMRMS